MTAFFLDAVFEDKFKMELFLTMFFKFNKIAKVWNRIKTMSQNLWPPSSSIHKTPPDMNSKHLDLVVRAVVVAM